MKIIYLNFLLLFTACTANKEMKQNEYFDIKEVFLNQIKVLNVEKPVFTKTIEMNSQKETKDLSTINWEKELDPFVQMDINKSAFAKSYSVLETDSTISYKLKKEEKLPIKSILIRKNPKSEQLQSIEIEASDHNLLYHWSKTLSANIITGKLKNYSIKGNQKILVFDAEIYSISAIRN